MSMLVCLPVHVMKILRNAENAVIGYVDDKRMTLNGYEFELDVRQLQRPSDAATITGTVLGHVNTVAALRHVSPNARRSSLTAARKEVETKRRTRMLRKEPDPLKRAWGSSSSNTKKRYRKLTPDQIRSMCFQIFEKNNGKATKAELLERLTISDGSLTTHFLKGYAIYSSKDKAYIFKDSRLRAGST